MDVAPCFVSSWLTKSDKTMRARVSGSLSKIPSRVESSFRFQYTKIRFSIVAHRPVYVTPFDFAKSCTQTIGWYYSQASLPTRAQLHTDT